MALFHNLYQSMMHNTVVLVHRSSPYKKMSDKQNNILRLLHNSEDIYSKNNTLFNILFLY